jgi:hypothetical protein
LFSKKLFSWNLAYIQGEEKHKATERNNKAKNKLKGKDAHCLKP